MEPEAINGAVATAPPPSPEPSPPPAPEPTPAPATLETPPPDVDPQAVQAYLKAHPEAVQEHTANWDHDTWKKVQTYNTQLKRSMEQRDQQARAARTEYETKARDWAQWEHARINDKERFEHNIVQPQAARYYAELQQWAQEQQRGGTGYEAQLVDRWTENAKRQLGEHPELAPIVEEWDKLMGESEGDPGTLIRRMIETGVAQEKRRLKAAADAEVEARVNAALNSRNARLVEPESPTGSVVTGPNHDTARAVFSSPSSTLAQKKQAWGEMYPGLAWPGPM